MGVLLDWARLLRVPAHATAVADVLAGWLVVSGHTEVGTVVAFISSIGRLNDP